MPPCLCAVHVRCPELKPIAAQVCSLWWPVPNTDPPARTSFLAKRVTFGELPPSNHGAAGPAPPAAEEASQHAAPTLLPNAAPQPASCALQASDPICCHAATAITPAKQRPSLVQLLWRFLGCSCCARVLMARNGFSTVIVVTWHCGRVPGGCVLFALLGSLIVSVLGDTCPPIILCCAAAKSIAGQPKVDA